jgi:2-hydroxychromene-2-carboxylate isomerase
MSQAIEFLFDFGSPYSYLAYHGVRQVAARHGAPLIWKPILLGGVFQATGNRSPMEVPAKGRWSQLDLARWAQFWGVPFHHNPFFPINTLTLMRGAIGYQMQGQHLPEYIEAIFSAMWQRAINLGDATELARVVDGAGLDSTAFGAMVTDAAVKERLKEVTQEAVARGVFGAPTFFVDGEMYWGQDRLTLIDEALSTASQR